MRIFKGNRCYQYKAALRPQCIKKRVRTYYNSCNVFHHNVHYNRQKVWHTETHYRITIVCSLLYYCRITFLTLQIHNYCHREACSLTRYSYSHYSNVRLFVSNLKMYVIIVHLDTIITYIIVHLGLICLHILYIRGSKCHPAGAEN